MYKRLVATENDGTQSLTPNFDTLSMQICIDNDDEYSYLIGLEVYKKLS